MNVGVKTLYYVTLLVINVKFADLGMTIGLFAKYITMKEKNLSGAW